MQAAKFMSPVLGMTSLLKKNKPEAAAAPGTIMGGPAGTTMLGATGLRRRRPGAAGIIDQGYGPGPVPTGYEGVGP